MQAEGERIANEERQRFVVDVGNAIQNFGAIEFLVNHLLSLLVNDGILLGHILEQPISKRLALLEQLIARRAPQLQMGIDGIKATFTEARVLFRERNKIAHNPVAAEEIQLISGATFRTGIMVLRFHDDGKPDEWIDLSALKLIIHRAHAVHQTLESIQLEIDAQL